MGIIPLASDAELIWVAQDPVIGVADWTTEATQPVAANKIDYRQAINDAFKSENTIMVSTDANLIIVPTKWSEDKQISFVVDERDLTIFEGLRTTDAQAVQASSGKRVDAFAPERRIQNERNNNIDVVSLLDRSGPVTPNATRAAESLPSTPNASKLLAPDLLDEEIRSAAVATDGESFVVGTDFYIELRNGEGDSVWRKSAPGSAWRVNVAKNGELIVAAYADGTIRWHNFEDGRELLAFYVAEIDGDYQWIAWTPAGYYDASPGAEDLIGWHINQGADKEALFFSASRFRDLYYNPDVVRSALKTLEITAPPTRDKLRSAAPPIVTILGQRAAPNGDVVIDYEVTTIFGEPVEVDIFIDNAKVDMEGARVVTLAGERQNITVPKGGCAMESIAIIARTSDGRASDAALVGRTARIGAVCDPGNTPKPDLHALLIGVSEYSEDSLTDLHFAHRDASDLKALFEAQKGRAYENVSVKVLTNQQATKTNIEAALADIEVAADDNDVTILFFAGHGVKSERLNDVFFLVHDSDINRLSNTAIEFVRFKTAIRRMNGRKFVFLDACFSAFTSTEGLSLFDMQGVSNILGGSDIRAEVFASSTGDQLSFENAAWENGAFTEAMLELFNNKIEVGSDPLSEILLKAYSGDGQITNDELNNWVKTRVKTLTTDRQTPSHTAAGSTQFMIVETE